MLLVSEPIIGQHESAAIARVINSGWITMGDNVRAFEQSFALMHGADDSVAVSSCTAALHLIVHALGIGPGDEVLVPAMSFVATANCVLYANATPTFVDITSLKCPLMSIEDAERKCNSRTKAVILVHFAGYFDEREKWREFARTHGLFLIEDAAHAPGITAAGTYGDAAAFSFYGNKNMTTAEGGAVIARDPSLLDHIRRLRGHGMTSGTHQRVTSRTANYDVTMLGFNYRMDELRAAFGLAQLKNLRRWNSIRAKLAGAYRQLIMHYCPSVIVPFTRSMLSSHHILPVILPADADRQRTVDCLRDAGIQTTIHYPPIHKLTYYRTRYPGISLPISETFAGRELTLPLHPRMTQGTVEKVVATLALALTPEKTRRELA